MDYTKICFVVMPFGQKPVGKQKLLGLITGDRWVDFDRIYDKIFVPAIEATELPEGGYLGPRRADRDFFTGDIGQEMFEYIEYSRFLLGDISGLNANVFYELGVRHRAHQAGTAIFRQVDAPIPFDINHIRTFPYEYEPDANIIKSQTLITQVLTDSLKQNRLDSPVQIALRAQREHGPILDGLLRDAENAIRNRDLPRAIMKYREAVLADGNNSTLHHELGLLLKLQGNWHGALAEFQMATSLAPAYADAQREKGIAENKLFQQSSPSYNLSIGEEALRHAIALNPEDFDAYASLGGIYKRQERFEEALVMYQRATELSRGHPYPLLNELKIQARINGSLTIDPPHRLLLERAERSRRAQVSNQPPYDPPWSFFDLSEIFLYLGETEQFLQFLDEGICECNDAWQVETHRDSLRLLVKGGLVLPGLEEGIRKLDEAVHHLRPIRT